MLRDLTEGGRGAAADAMNVSFSASAVEKLTYWLIERLDPTASPR
jgi:hypothetical protein